MGEEELCRALKAVKKHCDKYDKGKLILLDRWRTPKQERHEPRDTPYPMGFCAPKITKKINE